MSAILDTMRLAVGNRTISIHADDALAVHGRIAHVLDIDQEQIASVRADGMSASRPADVLVITDLEEAGFEEGADLDLANAVTPDGWLVLSADDATLRREAALSLQQHRGRVLWFGRAAHCDIAATDIAFTDGCLRFRIGQQWFQAPAWSRSSLKEVLAAVALARIFGVPLEQAAERLARSRPIGSRPRVVDAQRVTIIHDTADTTAASLGRSLDLLREFPAEGRRIVCCGELSGNPGNNIDRVLGEELVSRCGADELMACGASAHRVMDAARAAGLPARSAGACREADEAARRLAATLKVGEVLLVIGGPAEAMAQLVEHVRDSACGPDTSYSHVAADGLAAPLISLPQFTS